MGALLPCRSRRWAIAPAAELYAVRVGPWKAHYVTQPAYGPGRREEHDPPVLYNVEVDPSETTDIAKDHPDLLEQLDKRVAEHKRTIDPVPNQLEIPLAASTE